MALALRDLQRELKRAEGELSRKLQELENAKNIAQQELFTTKPRNKIKK